MFTKNYLVFTVYPQVSTNELLKDFKKSGSVQGQRAESYNCNCRSQENIEFVRASAVEDPKRFSSWLSKQVGFNEATILHAL